MRAHYRHALLYVGLFLFWGTVAYLQWYYHRRISAGVTAVLVVSLVGVAVEIRRGRRTGRAQP